MTRVPSTTALLIALLLPPVLGADPLEKVEISDDFPRLEVRGGTFSGRPCTEETRTACLPEGCEIDLSRTHSTSGVSGAGFGQGGEGYGVFVQSLNRPGDDNGGYASHELDPASRCLRSTVRVCALRRQRGWYEGHHVIYGVCGGASDGEENPPGNPKPSPAPQGACCGPQIVAATPCCPKPEKETCTFEVRLAASDVTSQDAFDGKAELQLTGYANGETAVHPSGSTWFIHHKKWGWKPANKLITRVEVEKGTTREVVVMAEGVEADIAGGGAPEHGASDEGTLRLTCGQPVTPAVVHIDFERLKTGPLASIVPSSLEVDVRFRAHQVTP